MATFPNTREQKKNGDLYIYICFLSIDCYVSAFMIFCCRRGAIVTKTFFSFLTISYNRLWKFKKEEILPDIAFLRGHINHGMIYVRPSTTHVTGYFSAVSKRRKEFIWNNTLPGLTLFFFLIARIWVLMYTLSSYDTHLFMVRLFN